MYLIFNEYSMNSRLSEPLYPIALGWEEDEEEEEEKEEAGVNLETFCLK